MKIQFIRLIKDLFWQRGAILAKEEINCLYLDHIKDHVSLPVRRQVETEFRTQIEGQVWNQMNYI